jgi:serine/threonine protein kinase
MVAAYLISGGPVTMERIFRAIDTEFSGLKVQFGSQGAVGGEDNIVICEEDTENLSRFTQGEYISLENDYMKAVAAIEDLERKQQNLYSQFELLRSKYDTIVSRMSNLLWSDCTPFHPELREIPPMETSDKIVESEVRIGPYKILEDIGEGQFAKVKNCIREEEKSGSHYALKIIHKEKITSLTALRRVSTEIKALQKLKGNFVTGFRDAIQTKSKLYIVLEKGGPDLFDFFDKYPGGVPEDVARKISIQLLNAILFCHQRMYCHRDIKPEVKSKDNNI